MTSVPSLIQFSDLLIVPGILCLFDGVDFLYAVI